ncbi:hypothetical protein BDY21DRAFT_213269 [Lineolata rhizophorae]|uniref:SAM domain-containing protein n=1 Tax=Lineolata rhizophorae TaxID=578093 RepID=A0A6A6P2V9_9PEZI|nr:hypothetical protein BDY21DRAFT_213269 [Lineolata rhizophorae]
MAFRMQAQQSRPGDILQVVHDFVARSPDELSLSRGDKIELIERDDEFGDGWFLGKHLQNGNTGLFPEVYTRLLPTSALGSLPSKEKPQTSISDDTTTEQATADENVTKEDMNQVKTVEPSPAELEATLPAPAPPASSDRPATPPEETELDSSALATNQQSPVGRKTPQTASGGQPRMSLSSTAPRNISVAFSDAGGSPVMNETLSVINEHITDMNTPRHSFIANEKRAAAANNDSASEYSSHLDHRLSYINGHETDEEERGTHTELEVMTWSPLRVAEYLEDVGVDRRHCDVFRDQEISGDVLLGMDQSQLFMKEFDLGPVGPRLRIWQKIKALQSEVKSTGTPTRSVSDYSAADDASNDAVRNRATSVGTVLPRIPSLMEPPNSKTGSRLPPPRTSTQPQPSIPESASASSPSAPTHSPGLSTNSRPSAASVRSLNHNRRHSSADFGSNSKLDSIPDNAQQATPPPSVTSHQKKPSFDRNWTMTAMQQTPPTPARPPTSHGHTMSSDGTKFDSPSRDLSSLTAFNTQDLDRGYFSGGEIENRNRRNVLRKKDSPAHSRDSSYTSNSRARAANAFHRHSRIESNDSNRDSVAPIVSPAAKIYYSTGKMRGYRSGSGTDFTKSMVTKETTPTVTKLDYGDSPSIDAIATSPNPAGSETSSIGRASPSPALQTTQRPRAKGLRAISDAVTGGEKSLATSPHELLPSPIKESPVQSPVRTGSSTPSGTSKSFELENADLPKTSTGSSGGLTPTSGQGQAAASRRKNKKTTSAYTRGLQKRTPQEQMIGCDYSGWMKKKSSNLMTTWKTRLFVLRGRRLSYYYSEDDTEEKGLIDISSHRVLPADNEFLTSMHATITGVTTSPTSPQNTSTPTSASADSGAPAVTAKETKASPGVFIFKLVPPRSGLSKAVNFTKPTVHYFAVDNVQQGRLWMAALMKATIERDSSMKVSSTYQQKTISLEKAKAMRQRPPAFMGDEELAAGGVLVTKAAAAAAASSAEGLAISGLNGLPAVEEKKADAGEGDAGGGKTSGEVDAKETAGGGEDMSDVLTAPQTAAAADLALSGAAEKELAA